MSTRPNDSFATIADRLRAAERICILSHVRPDPDAYGSQLAMALSLRAAGKKITVWNEDGMIERYQFLPGAELITTGPAEPVDFDVALVLDTANKERVGRPLASIGNASTWINIDHHQSNTRYGDLVHIGSDAPATGQILYEFLITQDFPFVEGVAENLFAAISTDTGSFQYPSTTARTYEIGADLIRRGVDVGTLSRQLYDSAPLRRVNLLKEMLNLMKLTADGRVCSAAIPRDVILRAGAQPDDTEGLIDTLRGIEGVLVAAFLEELDPERVRVSLRSKDPRLDVSVIAKDFNGGGHALAAGARPNGSLAEVETTLLKALHDAVQYLH